MMRSKIALFFDNIVFAFIFFIISFFWSYKLSKLKYLCLIICSSLSTILFLFLLAKSVKKYSKYKISKEDEKLFSLCLQKITYSTFSENICYFEKLLDANYLSNNIFENKNFYFYLNTFSTLSPLDFAIANNFYYQTSKQKPLFFIANDCGEEFSKLLNNCPTTYYFFNFLQLFLIMKRKNCYPKIEKQLCKKINHNFLIVAKNTLSKINFKNTFFSGISLVTISIFIPFSLYYLIFGTILLIFAFLSLLFKSKNNNNVINNFSIEDFFITKKDNHKKL